MKKIISIILALAMLFAIAPNVVLAADNTDDNPLYAATFDPDNGAYFVGDTINITGIDDIFDQVEIDNYSDDVISIDGQTLTVIGEGLGLIQLTYNDYYRIMAFQAYTKHILSLGVNKDVVQFYQEGGYYVFTAPSTGYYEIKTSLNNTNYSLYNDIYSGQAIASTFGDDNHVADGLIYCEEGKDYYLSFDYSDDSYDVTVAHADDQVEDLTGTVTDFSKYYKFTVDESGAYELTANENTTVSLYTQYFHKLTLADHSTQLKAGNVYYVKLSSSSDISIQPKETNTLTLGTTKVNNYGFYSFTPDKDYYYTFKTSGMKTDNTAIIDEEGYTIYKNNNSKNTNISYYFEKGKTYLVYPNTKDKVQTYSLSISYAKAPALTLTNTSSGIRFGFNISNYRNSMITEPNIYYVVYRKSGTKWEIVTDNDDYVYDEEVSSGKKYTYRICITNNNYEPISDYSSSVSIVYLKRPAISLSAGKKSITVKTKKVTGASKYVIEYSTSKSFKSYKKVTTTSTSKKISGLKKGKTYYVRVRAYKGSYHSSWSKVSKKKVTK